MLQPVVPFQDLVAVTPARDVETVLTAIASSLRMHLLCLDMQALIVLACTSCSMRVSSDSLLETT